MAKYASSQFPVRLVIREFMATKSAGRAVAGPIRRQAGRRRTHTVCGEIILRKNAFAKEVSGPVKALDACC